MYDHKMQKKTAEMDQRRTEILERGVLARGIDFTAAYSMDQIQKDELRQRRQLNSKVHANLPPSIPAPDVTPQEIQQFRISQQSLREAPKDQIRPSVQRLKMQRMRQAEALNPSNYTPMQIWGANDNPYPAAPSFQVPPGSYSHNMINVSNGVNWNGYDALGNPLSANLGSYYQDSHDNTRDMSLADLRAHNSSTEADAEVNSATTAQTHGEAPRPGRSATATWSYQTGPR